MKLDIFLENERLDIDGATNLAITYRFSDLTNPTTQTGDYSTKFTIKGTPHNNAVFGQIWRLDRVALLGGDFNTSVYFNPSKRTNCVIFINNEVFKRGYVQLNSIKNDKGAISYEVTFFSQMVDVLRTLNESKLRDLPFPNDLRHTLNAQTIRTSWEQTALGGLWDYLTYIMANNGLYEEFESGKWLTGSVTDPQVTDILPNGLELDECAKREYRSYYQRPALRLRGLIELIAEQHGIQLDPTFFNDNNPYFADSVMALPQYNIMEQETTQTGVAQYTAMPTTITYTSSGASNTVVPQYKATGAGDIFSEDFAATLNLASVQRDKIAPIVEFEFRVTATMATTINVGETLKWGNTVLMPAARLDYGNGAGKDYDMASVRLPSYIASGITFRGTGEQNNTVAVGYFDPKYYGRNYTPNGSNQLTQWIPMRGVLASFLNTSYITGRTRISVEVLGNHPQYVMLLYRPHSSTGLVVTSFKFEFRPITKLPSTGGVVGNYYPQGFNGQDMQIGVSHRIRSGYGVDKRDIIDNETTQGEFLINYAKLFGLIFYTDKDGTPHLVTRNTFFKDYKVEDWTQKIDHAKAIAQTPIPFDAKYLSMHYQSGETYYEEYYKHQYETEYGEQRIDTGYEFNTKDTEILPDTMFYNTVMSQESTRVLVEKNGAAVMQFMQDTKTLPALFVKEDNQRNPSDTKFNLLFDNGQHKFVESGNWRDIPADERIWLTDDYNAMLRDNIGGGQVCWIDTEHYHPVAGSPDSILIPELLYPVFSTLHKSGAYSWHLGYPVENYAGWMRSDFPESATIFANFWRNYIAEIYDVDNRILTAYVRLTATDIAQFSFGNFVRIGDTLWHVNKIDQFNPLGNGLTKVEFLRVSSLSAIENAYVNGQTDMTPPTPQYTVTVNLTGVDSDAVDTIVNGGDAFTANFSATELGYQIVMSVMMGDEYITGATINGVKVWQPSPNNARGVVNIANVSGDVLIVAQAWKL